MRPKARTEALIVETLPDETLIYDQRTEKAHCLNGTASIVWKMADGSHTVDEIASTLDLPDAPDIVAATLEELRRTKLLEDNGGTFGRPISRREMTRRIGVGAALAAIPTIMTITAPAAAQTASCTPLHGCCSGGGTNCCAGLHCNNSTTTCGSGKECT